MDFVIIIGSKTDRLNEEVLFFLIVLVVTEGLGDNMKHLATLFVI